MRHKLPLGFVPLTNALPESEWKGKHMAGRHPNGYWFVVRLVSQHPDRGGFQSVVVKSRLTEGEAEELCDALGRFGPKLAVKMVLSKETVH